MGASHSRQAVEASYGPRVKQCIRNRKQFIADIEEANTMYDLEEECYCSPHHATRL